MAESVNEVMSGREAWVSTEKTIYRAAMFIASEAAGHPGKAKCARN
jgi:hypothetical protein